MPQNNEDQDMIKKGLPLVLFFLFCSHLFSQSKSDSLALNFQLEFNKLPLEINKKYISNQDTLTIETFKCYISNLQIQYKDTSIFIEKDSYHLLDFDNPKSFEIPLTKKNDKLIAKITFTIGIDSVTSNSGALTDDLDPINGMYWAWQSGYINMKIKGKCSSCKTRQNEFQFHIGGYLKPNYAMRKVEIICNDNIKINSNINENININIGMELKDFFSNIELSKTNSIMIPGKDAMELADESVKMFHLK